MIAKPSHDAHLSRYNLTDLRVFRAVAEEGNLSRGAQRSHLSPSSASLRLKGLENAIGTPLLERRTRSMELTRAGKTMLAHVQNLTTLLEQMHVDMQPFARDLKKNIVLFANSHVIHTHLPVDLALFLNSFPELRVTTEERPNADILSAVAAGHADVGIVASVPGHPGLRFLPYCQEQWVVLMPPGSAPEVGKTMPFAATLDRPFVGLMNGAACHAFLVAQAAALGRQLDVRVQVPGYRSIVRLVGLGAGIGIVPQSVLEPGDMDRLCVVPLEDPWSLRHHDVCVRTGALESNGFLAQLLKLLCRRTEAVSGEPVAA